MKQHLTLNELAAELTRQEQTKRDFIATTSAMKVDFTDDATKTLEVGGAVDDQFELTDHAHRQLAGRLGIPWKFYGRMLDDHPDCLERDVNALFEREPENRMVRTLDGRARAFLSSRYRRLDNYQLAEHVLPVLNEQEIDVARSSFAITESRMFMKLVFPRVEGEVRKGDVVQSGVIISNSEVGAGVLRITPLVFRLVCLNGLVAPQSVDQFKRTHLGKELEVDGLAGPLYRTATLEAADKALWMEVEDLTRATASPELFAGLLSRMQEAADASIDGSPVEAVRVLSDRLGITELEQEGILSHLVRGGDMTQWGLLNAVTRHAQDVESYERSTELEEIGGKVLDLPRSAWTSIAMAA